jgi:hypothetical protein
MYRIRFLISGLTTEIPRILREPNSPRTTGNASHGRPDGPGTGSSQYPRNRRRMNIEKPRGISASFGALRHHHDNFILLIRSELWTTASNAAPLTGCIQPSLCSFPKYSSFKLGKCSHHLHHHPPRSSSGIELFHQTPESGSSFVNPFHNHQDVPKRTRSRSKRQTTSTSPSRS